MLKSITRLPVVFLIFICLDSYGQVNLPEKSGFRGFVRPSVGGLNFSNNMVASFLRYDLADKQTHSIYEKPESQNMFLSLLPFDLTYTFGKSRTQLFFGTQLDDLIRFNLTQQIGVKQQFDKFGIVQVSFLLNGLPTMVWSDPYMANTDRIETDRHSYGMRILWDLILNSNFRIQYASRKIRLGQESSGEYLGLMPEARSLLSRNGFLHTAELLYWIKMKNRQLLAPAISLVVDVRDGSARSRNAMEFKLNYTWLGKKFKVTANGFVGYTKFQGENPIYLKTQEDTYLSLITTLYYANPWDWKIGNSEPLNFFVSFAGYQSNTNIDFYYRNAFLVTTGVFIRWAKK